MGEAAFDMSAGSVFVYRYVYAYGGTSVYNSSKSCAGSASFHWIS